MLNGSEAGGRFPEMRLDRWFVTASTADEGSGTYDDPDANLEPSAEPALPAEPEPDVVGQLRDAIAAAVKRAESARFRAESRRAAAHDALRSELMATRRQIEEMEARHHDEVAAIRAGAHAEAQAIIDAAHRTALTSDLEGC